MRTGSSPQETLTLADLYDVYESKLLRYATIMVGNPDWAEDLVQENLPAPTVDPGDPINQKRSLRIADQPAQIGSTHLANQPGNPGVAARNS